MGKINELLAERDKVKNLQEQINKKISKHNSMVVSYWRGKFVKQWLDEVYLRQELLPLGLKELDKYNIDYFEEGVKESGEWMWENHGISYTPDECFCMICHSHNLVSFAQIGLAPRFAACAKHGDFLHLYSYLKKRTTH